MLSATYPKPPPPPRRMRKRYIITERQVDGFPVFDIAPRGTAQKRHMIYLHGGAYVNQMIGLHWNVVDKLIQAATGAHLTVPLYPLAPEHHHRATFDMLNQVWRDVTEKKPTGDIVLCGDSAGGGLALAFAMEMRDQGMPSAERLILFAPWLDITLSDPAAYESRKLTSCWA